MSDRSQSKLALQANISWRLPILTTASISPNRFILKININATKSAVNLILYFTSRRKYGSSIDLKITTLAQEKQGRSMRFKTWLATAGLATVIMSLAFGARADAPSTILYNNPYDAAADNGSCLWTSTCAADQLASGTLAAQAFQLTSSASLTSVSFTELDLGDNAPTSVSWNIYADSLSTGLPGSLIASGASAVSSTIDLGPDLSGSFTVTQGSFSLPSVYLGSGSYDLAIQAQSSSFDDFLAQGASSTGAAQSFDGGASFTSGYGQAPYTLPSLAVSISGLPNVSAAPEPSVWALMIFGIGVVGAVLRLARRRYHPESRCSVMGAML